MVQALIAGAAASNKGLHLAAEMGLDGTVAHHHELDEKRNSVQVESAAPTKNEL